MLKLMHCYDMDVDVVPICVCWQGISFIANMTFTLTHHTRVLVEFRVFWCKSQTERGQTYTIDEMFRKSGFACAHAYVLIFSAMLYRIAYTYIYRLHT